MVVFSMAREPFPVWSQLTAWALPLVAAVDALAPRHAPAALHAYLGAVVTSYALFVVGAILQIAGHLRISVFTIDRRPTPASQAHLAPPASVAATGAQGGVELEEKKEEGKGRKAAGPARKRPAAAAEAADGPARGRQRGSSRGGRRESGSAGPGVKARRARSTSKLSRK
jgi:hypothetical protein